MTTAVSRSASAAPHPPTIVYADFTNSGCYLASLRTDRLIAAGHQAPDWRAVEHRVMLPRTGIHLDGSAHALRGRDLAATRQFLGPGEVFDARNPGILPSTRLAIAAYAGAYDSSHADQVRRILFEAYWVEGANIGDPQTLHNLLAPVPNQSQTGPETPPLNTDVAASLDYLRAASHHRVRDWHQTWLRLGTPAELTVVSPHHSAEHGASALNRLAATRPMAA